MSTSNHTPATEPAPPPDSIRMPSTRVNDLIAALKQDDTLLEVGRILREAAADDGNTTLSHSELHKALALMPASARPHFQQMEEAMLRDYDRLPMRPVAMMASGFQVRSVNGILSANALPRLDNGIVNQVLRAHGR